MAIERADPIPAGRYWLDAIGPVARAAWEAWSRSHAATVRVDTVEDHGERLWVLFTVSAPTPRWPTEARLGLPTIAPATVQSGSDTVQRPAVERFAFPWEGATSIGGTLSVLLWLATAGAIGYAVARLTVHPPQRTIDDEAP